MSDSHQRSCLNCGDRVESNYCSSCGQKDSGPGLNFSELLQEVFSTVFNLEAPFLKTFRTLMRKPGQMVRAYIAGKRRSYYKPVPFLILAVALYIFIRFLFDYDPIEATIESTGGQDMMAPAQRQASYWMEKNLNFILPFWVLIISFLDRVFFKSSLNFTERVVIYLFFLGQYILLSLMVIPLTKLAPQLMFVQFLIMIVYLTYAIASLHGKGAWIWIRSALLVLVSFFIYGGLSNLILIYYFTRFAP